MTKKYFIELANTLANHRTNMESEAFSDLISDIAEMCKKDNANFDRQRFIAACNREV